MTAPFKLLKAWELRARKELGQNFLKEPGIAAQIASHADITARDCVLEIGAGMGILTIAVAQAAGKVYAVEKDPGLIPLLRSELLSRGLTDVIIVQQDILRLDLREMASQAGDRLIVLGNLPYNISSQVVVKLIEERQAVKRAVLMFQKELAQRLVAAPGSKAYGRLSVLLQYCADLKALRDIKANQFFPQPKVDSAVLRIDFKSEINPRVGNEELLVRVVQAAFGQRRKTLRNALSAGLAPLSTQEIEQLLSSVGIDPGRRAETLSVQEFVALTDRLEVFRS